MIRGVVLVMEGTRRAALRARVFIPLKDLGMSDQPGPATAGTCEVTTERGI